MRTIRQCMNWFSGGRQSKTADKLDAIAWAAFFIWVGIALLFDVGYGIGLLGVAVITLGAQLARKRMGIETEGFWIVVGLLFLIGGIWELLQIEVSLIPILLILVGVLILVTRLWPHADAESRQGKIF